MLTDRETVLAELEQVEAELCRRHLAAFVRKAWGTLEPSTPLVWNWHLDALCWELEQVSRGDTTQLIINVPPGTMKSLLVSVLWPAWEWTWAPHQKYLAASYGADLAVRDTMKMRDLVTSAWYQRLYGVKLRADQEAKTWYINSLGGWRIATSPGGKGTGEHPTRKIIDDPLSAQQARSEAERKAVIDWHDQTLASRGATLGARTVLIMQRLHEDDLAGHLLRKGGWRHVCIPMRYATKVKPTDPEPYEKDPRKGQPGALLWPALYPADKVAKLERDLGDYGTAGQMQQRPAPAEGGLFKRGQFRIVDQAPSLATRTRAWDIAGTPGAGKRTAGVRMADAGEGVSPRYYIEDVVLGQWAAHDVDARMHTVAHADGRQVRIREEQEPGSAGLAVVQTRARSLPGFDYQAVPATGDKETRAMPLRTQVGAGEVALVRGPWNEAFLQEAELFPNGLFKDQIDAAAHAFNDLATGPRPAKVRSVRWG